jgi:hypothetical protein
MATYPKGIRTFNKHMNAPSFVVCDLVIDLNEFIEWCKVEGREHLTDYNGRKQLKLELVEGREKINIQVKQQARVEKTTDFPSDLPF